MKRLIISIGLLLSTILLLCAQTQVDTTKTSSPKILIISSYQYGMDWSRHLVRQITTRLTRQYPDIYIHNGYMNLDMFTLPANPLFTLRSILWSYADSETRVVSPEDNHVNSLFASDECPDVLVFIGDDALLFYQMYGLWLGKWKDVPIVVCGASDYVAGCEYRRLNTPVDFDLFVPIEQRRKVDVLSGDKDVVSIDYNLTGVKNTVPVRENLELIRQLMPELEEIVWVDNDFYSSGYAQWLLKKEASAVLPGVRLAEIRQNRFNTDSIYNEIFRPISNKAYLTYSWDVNGVYSRRTDEQIRTQFVNYSNVPMFSLTQRFSTTPYWVGGYYRSHTELADKTIKQINRILKGEPANEIPFETITGGGIILDQPLLKKYNLLACAETLQKVEYLNVPPTYYEENEVMILAGIIIGTMILGLLLYWLSRYRYTRKLHKEYIRYKKLYSKLHLIYGHTSIDMALYDKKGNLIFSITKGRESHFGNGKSDVFAENVFENPNLNKHLKEQIQNNQSINSEITIDSEGPLSTLDSERKIYQLIVKPLNEENSRSAKYVAIAINLNQVVREREARERFGILVRFASDSSQVGIAFYDMDTAAGTATNSWYQNLNESLAPGVCPTYESVAPEDRSLLMEFRRKVQHGEKVAPFNRDICVRGKDGEEHWITQHVFVDESNPKMLVELNLNIDEQKATENDLRMAKERVEQSIRSTQEFLANINHEIRTPLNSIVGFSAILAASVDEEERKEYVALILKNNKLLTMLIDDVIELSRIDSGQAIFNWEPIRIGDLFKKVMRAGYSELYNKQLDMIQDLDEENPIVYTDYEALYRLLVNLVSNAIKFTVEGNVTLGYRKEKDNYYFYVKDTGKGIAEKDQQRIFKRFDKLDSYMQGTGLGLSLCKSIVESLGGEIGVESETDKGSTFWFVLPIK